jgi:hypothetical protein
VFIARISSMIYLATVAVIIVTALSRLAFQRSETLWKDFFIALCVALIWPLCLFTFKGRKLLFEVLPSK